mgnify:FL=1
MALGYLALMFVIMSVISIVGLVLLLIIKNEKANRAILYIMSAWGILIAVMNITALPINWIMWRVVAGVCGLIGLAGGIVRFTAKERKTVSALLAIVSVLAGMIMLFVI